METPADSGTSTETTESTDSTFDMDSAVTSIASDLGFKEEPEAPEAEENEIPAVGSEEVSETTEETKPAIKEPPKSWAKDYHEPWSKLDPKVQEYIETREKQMLDGIEQYKEHSGLGKQLKDVITPYDAILRAQGVDAPQAIQYLLNAHYRLTQGTAEQRQAAYQELGKNLGFVEGEAKDPKYQALEQKLSAIESTLTMSQQRALQETQAKVSKEVEAFASDSKHPYFDDVADDIVAMIQAGRTLEDAYEKAVWANPVTRQKEIARLDTERQTQAQKKAKEEAEKAKKASSANVKSRDTNKAPTEPKGTMEDTMRETLSQIRSRTH
jgi:hypothetical protein